MTVVILPIKIYLAIGSVARTLYRFISYTTHARIERTDGKRKKKRKKEIISVYTYLPNQRWWRDEILWRKPLAFSLPYPKTRRVINRVLNSFGARAARFPHPAYCTCITTPRNSDSYYYSVPVITRNAWIHGRYLPDVVLHNKSRVIATNIFRV